MNEAALWTDLEAYLNQVEQIGASACGATAILNVFVKINYLQKQNLPSKNIKFLTKIHKERSQIRV
jgi:hypothetical protein